MTSARPSTTATTLGEQAWDGPESWDLARIGLAFVAVPVIALLSVWLGATGIQVKPVIASAVLLAGIVVVVATLGAERLPVWAQPALAASYFLSVALLRHGAGGGRSGLAPLLLLPILWGALYGDRRQLRVYLVLATATLVVPILLIGPPLYPEAEWRRAAILSFLAAFIGVTVQNLVSQTRRQMVAIVEAQQESDRVKDEFLSLVSHELRTPLTSIIGYLEELLEDEDEPPSEHQHRFLLVIRRNSERLLRLVNDVLLLVRSDSGEIYLSRRLIDVRPIFDHAVEGATPAAQERSVQLVYERPEGPVTIFADHERMEQVIDNLVSNAIKYSPDGGRVTLRSFNDAGTTVLEVEDEGIGIPASEQERLFERFFRASTATDRTIPGVGLGLTIVRLLVEAHGGNVSFDSTEGEGTCFRLTLPSSEDRRHHT